MSLLADHPSRPTHGGGYQEPCESRAVSLPEEGIYSATGVTALVPEYANLRYPCEISFFGAR